MVNGFSGTWIRLKVNFGMRKVERQFVDPDLWHAKSIEEREQIYGGYQGRTL